MLAIDIDHFKRVNDSHGHQIGDQVIIKLAQTLKVQSRSNDLLARFGGEEFVMLLPETDQEQALVCAERIRTAVEKQIIAISPEQQLSLAVSIGAAVINAEHESIEAALNRADKALYEAKNGGRNRVCINVEG